MPARSSRSIAYAIAIAIAGLIGDLTESLLKRDAGVKDSSTWMPGFGGVLDLLDSLLGGGPGRLPVLGYCIWVGAVTPPGPRTPAF